MSNVKKYYQVIIWIIFPHNESLFAFSIIKKYHEIIVDKNPQH